MRVWLIEKATSPVARPLVLAEDDAEVLRWTRDAGKALRFSDRDGAERFLRGRVTDPVCIAERDVDDPTGWAAENIALRVSRDAMDAFKAREAAELARAA